MLNLPNLWCRGIWEMLVKQSSEGGAGEWQIAVGGGGLVERGPVEIRELMV